MYDLPISQCQSQPTLLTSSLIGISKKILQLIFGKYRGLTANERKLVMPIFNDSIDYDKVKIHHGRFIPIFQPSQTAMTPFGTIHFPNDIYEEDYANPTQNLINPNIIQHLFVHEMTHVWQYQLGYSPFLLINNYFQGIIMFKILFYLLLLLFSSYVHSASTLAKDDGKILIVLKNNYPCFYLVDNEPIYHIGLASRGVDGYKYNYSHKIGEEKFGFSKSTCITANHHTKFPYNTPFSVYVGGYNNAYTQNSPNDIQGNRSSSHLYSTTNFCILKSQTEKTRLVKARKSHFWETGGQFKCTDQDWIPK